MSAVRVARMEVTSLGPTNNHVWLFLNMELGIYMMHRHLGELVPPVDSFQQLVHWRRIASTPVWKWNE